MEELFSPETEKSSLLTEGGVKPPWKILVADDEEDVHSITKMVLKNFSFQGRKLKFLHALSGREAKTLLEEHDDIAVAFLDVVMEENDSGLEVVHHLREVLNNRLTRIILRTGHPGYAPEKEVIFQHEINDYRCKTELTDMMMVTCLTTAIRSYSDLMTLERYRRTLEEKVRERTAQLNEKNHLLLEANKKLEELSHTDCLTGLYNRRKGDEILAGELERCQRYDKALSLIVFDLDNFKRINDRFGHDRGDKVICAVAETVKKHIRVNDVFSRWGGEEFVIMLPETMEREARKMAELARHRIEKIELLEEHPITCSFGVAQYRKEDNPLSLFKRADQALYQAKMNGRNRVICC